MRPINTLYLGKLPDSVYYINSAIYFGCQRAIF